MIVDLPAERIVTACAAETDHGATLARRHGVTPEMFWHPGHRRLFAAATSIELFGERQDRAERCAELAGVAADWARDLVDGTRPVHWDTSGSFARRVVTAAGHRARAAELLAELEHLGVTDPATLRPRDLAA